MTKLSSIQKNGRAGAKLGGLLFLLAVAALLLAACSGQASAGADSGAAGDTSPTATTAGGEAGTVSFSKDVLPILQSRCVNCHGGQKTEKGFNLTSYDKLMAGSQRGPVVVAGDPDHSVLIQMIQQGKMPKTGPKLLPAQLQTLIDWVKAGALNN